jgi:hypothetical protein
MGTNLKPVDRKQLKLIASMLPPVDKIQRTRVVVKGTHLPPELTSKEKDFDPSTKYSVVKRVPVRINHYDELKAAYKRGGVPAVDEYLKPYYKQLEDLGKIKKILEETPTA